MPLQPQTCGFHVTVSQAADATKSTLIDGTAIVRQSQPTSLSVKDGDAEYVIHMDLTRPADKLVASTNVHIMTGGKLISSPRVTQNAGQMSFIEVGSVKVAVDVQLEKNGS